MGEDKNLNIPERCLYCKSDNMIGPYKYTMSGGVEIGSITYIRQVAFVCVDCGFTMLFTREGDGKKVLKESMKKQPGFR